MDAVAGGTTVFGRQPRVEPESIDELAAAVRRAAFSADDDLVARIDRALATAEEPIDLGRLLVVKSLALQGRGDPGGVADLVRRAVPMLTAAGAHAHAAFAATTTAVFLDQAGDVNAAVEYAVAALVLLEGLELDQLDGVRASLALSGWYLRRCAFDLAVDLGRRAFQGALRIDGDVPIDAVAFTTGYVAAEAGHLATDATSRDAYLEHAGVAAAWLAEHGKDDISRVLLCSGLEAEIALARGAPVARERLDAASALYGAAIADFVAWHQLVRGIAAARDGDAALAIELLTHAEPGLRASGDDHCLVRALRTRAGVKATIGDHVGAYADAVALAECTRRWQLEHVGTLAGQLARRAELERSSSALMSAAERLAADVDTDPLTGVRSRRWLERELDAIERRGGVGSVVMIDVDRFKLVNDTHGHTIGDQVLARVGAVLVEAAGPDCAVARFGGEEFAVVVGAPDASVALRYAHCVRAGVRAERWADVDGDLVLTVSAGVATGELSEVRLLVQRADAALLDAKRSGRDRVMVWAAAPPSPTG
jgi:diguanylate cyclase (GGDEF)-like protein